MRWHFHQRKDEVDRVRRMVEIAGAGLGNVEPLSLAEVKIRAYGDYSRYDADGVYFKDCIDSIVARPVRVYGRSVARRWGMVLDDSRKVIGKPDFDDVMADSYRVEIEVQSRNGAAHE